MNAGSTVHPDDAWQLSIEQCKDGNFRTKPANGCAVEDIEVSQPDFDTVQKGSVITFDPTADNRVTANPR